MRIDNSGGHGYKGVVVCVLCMSVVISFKSNACDEILSINLYPMVDRLMQNHDKLAIHCWQTGKKLQGDLCRWHRAF